MFPTHLTRRAFLKSTAALTTVGSTVPYWSSDEKANTEPSQSKNDRPHIALIGAGGRGGYVAQWAAKFSEIVALCDVDLRRAEELKARFGGKLSIYQDYRKLLERKDVEAVINATPDHWHTAINIAACKADKDVYAEKPLTLSIDEGKLLCRVVDETKRIVQVGTMQRSDRPFQTAVELVRNGRIGKLRQVWVALPYYATSGGPFPRQPVPPQLDWDFYQGQAPEHDYCRQRTHSNYRWWYEYAGGIVTDWGNHHVDIAHWGMGCDLTGPVSVEARGLFPNPPDSQHYNTPDRFFSRMAYAGGLEVLFFASLNQRARYGEVGRHEDTPPERVEWLFGPGVPEEIKSYNRDGIMFIGDAGRVFVNRGGVHGKAVDELKQNPLPADAWRAYPSADHMTNFIECLKTRRQPCTPVQVEHRTATACHLTNISLRLKRKIAWDPDKQRIIGDDDADGWQRREQRKPYVISG